MDLASGRVIPVVERIEEARIYVYASQSSGVGTGGMSTKLDAAAIAVESGVPAHLTRGPTDEVPDPIARVLAGDPVGTRFAAPGGAARKSRKSWIAHAARAQGTIHVDAGAARAVRERGASLLPSGVTGVEGRFEPGAPVDIRDANGKRIARGLASYGSAEILRIKGQKSEAILPLLGYCSADEVVHRDDLLILEDPR